MTLEEARERFSSPLLHGALAFAIEAHQSPTAGETQVSHPVAVAGLLQDAGCAEEVVAAGLLHDVVEDTPFTLEEIKGRFGEPVSVLVAAMTEDEGIEAYGLRKEEHRRRVGLRSGRTAAIYAADKLASLRAAKQEGHEVGRVKSERYHRTLGELEQTHPQLVFLGQLCEELEEERGAG